MFLTITVQNKTPVLLRTVTKIRTVTKRLVIKTKNITGYLSFNLALHLQRVYKDAPVPDEASAGDSSVRLAEAFLIKFISETLNKYNIYFMKQN